MTESVPSRRFPVSNNVTVFLNLFIESRELENVTRSMSSLPEVMDLYEVTGEYDVVAELSVADITAFRELLKNRILKIPGVKSTVSSVVLYTHKREGASTGE